MAKLGFESSSSLRPFFLCLCILCVARAGESLRSPLRITVEHSTLDMNGAQEVRDEGVC